MQQRKSGNSHCFFDANASFRQFEEKVFSKLRARITRLVDLKNQCAK